MPGKRLAAWTAIAALGGVALWALLGRLEARLRAHDDMLAEHAALRHRDAAKVDALYDALSAAYASVGLPVPPGVTPIRADRGLRVVKDRTEAG